MTVRTPQSTSRVYMLKAYLSSDHVSPATGKTIAVVLSKNGGAFANPNAGATNATEIANGWYKVTLDATDHGTLGDLVIRGTEGTIDPIERIVDVIDANAGGLARLDAAVSSRSSHSAADVWAVATRVLTANTNLGIVDAAGIRAAVGLASASLDTQLGDLPAIKAKTDNLPSDPADQSLLIAATNELATLIGDVPTNAELATALAAADDATLAQIAFVKAKTDQLAFTVAGKVDANITHVNEIAVTGDGSVGAPWGPA